MEVASSALPAVIGALSHIVYFNRGEHHLYVLAYVQAIAGCGIALASTFIIIRDYDDATYFIFRALTCMGWFFFGLYFSLFAYRIWFHPLKVFPGPFGAKLSSLWLSTRLARGDAHQQVLKLHQKYGDFVRIGSSDLSVIHPKGVSAIYGSTSKCIKGSWYDLTHPMVSLQTTRQKDLHQHQRRIWSNAFSDKALRGYEERIKVYREKLMNHISASASDNVSVDVTQWFNFFTFDVMGDLAFGAPFHMLETSKQHWAIEILGRGLEPLSWHLPVWCFRLLMAIPGLSGDWWRFTKYCCERLDERLMKKTEQPDIMSTLLEPWEGKPLPETGRKLLEGDSQLIIVAGSDTTAATITHVLYELVRNPNHISKLRDELTPFLSDGRIDDYRKIQNLQHLNGVINEALRLHPPVPTTLSRRTPPEGIDIGGIHIPGNVTVWCPQYVIGRAESLYEDAGCFVPERWYSRQDMVTDKTVFAPFSTGAYSCIGKSLALQNIRNTIVELITRFDITAGPNNDLELLEERTKDHFTMGLPPLRLSFSKRNSCHR